MEQSSPILQELERNVAPKLPHPPPNGLHRSPPPVVCSCMAQSSPILQELERNVAPKLANVMLICLEAESRQGGGAGLDSVSVRGEGRGGHTLAWML